MVRCLGVLYIVFLYGLAEFFFRLMGCGLAPAPVMTVSRNRRGGLYSPFAIKAAWKAGQWMGNKVVDYVAKSGKRRKTGKGSGSSRSGTNNVTFQHDYAHIYSRKKAPRSVRRRARKAAFSFNKRLVASLGQKTWNRSGVFASGTITPTGLGNSQSVFDLGLFGGNSTGSNTWGDLYAIAAGNGDGLNDVTGKLWFQSACLDVQLKNTTGLGEGFPTAVTICVELYTVYARRDGYFFPGEDWNEAMDNQDLLDNGGAKATPLSLNATPFDAPGFGSSWLIAKKVRYRISPGNSVYLQMRDPKRKCFDTARFEWDSGSENTRIKTFKGWTRGYIFVIRSDTAVTSPTPLLVPFSYQAIFTKNYKYAQQESNRDAQVFNP